MSQPALPAFISRQVEEGQYWFLNLQVGDAESTVAVCGGYERVRPDYLIQRQEFVFRTVELVVSGFGTVELAGRKFAIAPGVAYSYGPGVPHRIQTDAVHVLKKYFLCFSGQVGDEIVSTGVLGDGGPVYVADTNLLVDFFDLLQSNASNGSPRSIAICDRLAEAILLKLDESSHATDRRDRRAVEAYHTAHQHFRANFLSIATIGEAASHLGYSAEYLVRLFRRFGQTTPHRYLTRLKMGYAASTLMQTGCRVKELANQLGYSDQFHFSRAFKAEFGVSPSVFLSRVKSSE